MSSCRSDEKAAIACDKGFKINGTHATSTSSVVCIDGKWKTKEENISVDEETCVPHCKGSCLNGGICVSPNVCDCNSNFFGPSCQFNVCPVDPPVIPFGSFDGRFVISLVTYISYKLLEEKEVFILQIT